MIKQFLLSLLLCCGTITAQHTDTPLGPKAPNDNPYIGMNASDLLADCQPQCDEDEAVDQFCVNWNQQQGKAFVKDIDALNQSMCSAIQTCCLPKDPHGGH